MKLIAITRKVSQSINNCKLSHIERVPINYDLAVLQHTEYENTLKTLGAKVISLPALDKFPDSVFVEDCAIVFDECAVITRPGDDTRRGETVYIYEELSNHRTLLEIIEPGTLDGGDVLCIGKEIYIGLSNRSNYHAVDQLSNLMNVYGYSVKGVTLKSCLHLKSAVTYIGSTTLLINPDWINKNSFPNYDFIEVDSSEPHAANVVLINNKLVFPDNYPNTLAKLRNKGFDVVTVACDQLALAEGAVTCSALLFSQLTD